MKESERLPRNEYKEAEGLLRRYNYNCINILNIPKEILGVSAQNLDGMPKTPYKTSDSVYNQFIRLEEDEQLSRSIREYKIVEKALKLLTKEHEDFFELFYRQGKSKYDVMDELHFELATFKRRKKDLIYTVHKEIKKLSQN